MKKTLSLIAFLSFAFIGTAQEQTQSESVGPKKGNVSVSVNFGVGSYLNMNAPKPNLTSYTLSAPMSAWFDKKPMLDVEGRYFVSDKWAVKLTGGFAFSHNPGYNEVTGTAEGSTLEAGDVPTYNAVPSSDNLQFAVTAGADHYFAPKFDRLFLRIGGEVGFAYGRTTSNAVDSEEYAGSAVGEASAFRVAPVFGMDYFIAKSLFVGIDIRPLAYQYSVYSERPQA